MIRERVHAGLRRAVANGKVLGRPLNDPDAVGKARKELAKGIGTGKVARSVGLGVGTVHKLAREMAAAN